MPKPNCISNIKLLCLENVCLHFSSSENVTNTTAAEN